jgi:ribonuclease R
MNLRESVINFFEESRGKYFRKKLLMEKLSLSKNDESELNEIINSLLSINYLIKKRDSYSRNPRLFCVKGRVSSIKGGSAFLIDPERKNEDYFIPSSKISSAYDGDYVLCQISKEKEAKVIYIIQRGSKKIAGIVNEGYLFPYEGGEPIPVTSSLKNKVAVLKEIPQSGKRGDVEILGEPLDVKTVLKVVEAQFNLRKDFDDEILKECEKIKGKAFDFEGRRDLKNLPTITIDPLDAKDFDDAISILKEDKGNSRIFVHIADVSYFVKEGTLTDIEARRRGNSVYLPTTVYPMLPETLSNDFCSLNEKEDKLCVTVEMLIDPQGEVLNCNFYESIINSRKRMNYEEAESILDGGKFDDAEVSRIVLEGYETAKILNKKRYLRGALDFDLEKPHLGLKDDKFVESIFPEIRLKSHKLIEEFMLLANESVAKFLSRNKMGFLYRVHEEPDPEKIEKISPILQAFNINLSNKKKGVTGRDLQVAIERARGKSYERLVSYIILRAMMRARYSEIEGSHFGLALEKYCHFTSPIRRYPDLVVHRALKRCKRGIKQGAKDLKVIAENCTETERIADEAEREAFNWLCLNFLKDKVGDSFKVIITGFTKFGMKVEMVNELIEGIIPFNTMVEDHFLVDSKGFIAKGRRTSKIYKVGQIVDAQLIKLDLFNREPQFKTIQ